MTPCTDSLLTAATKSEVLRTAISRPMPYGTMMAKSSNIANTAHCTGCDLLRSISANDKSLSGMVGSGCLDTSTCSTFPRTISVAVFDSSGAVLESAVVACAEEGVAASSASPVAEWMAVADVEETAESSALPIVEGTAALSASPASERSMTRSDALVASISITSVFAPPAFALLCGLVSAIHCLACPDMRRDGHTRCFAIHSSMPHAGWMRTHRGRASSHALPYRQAIRTDKISTSARISV